MSNGMGESEMKIGWMAVGIILCFGVVDVFPDFTTTEIWIPMRDGKFLAADLYTTDPSVSKPVILIQTPYDKDLQRTAFLDPDLVAPLPLDTAAFNYVVVDWRGFHDSEQAGEPGAYDRGKDGYDTVEWISWQSWSNGKVGTYGPSALGLIQFQTARFQPPHLVCAMPTVKDFKTKYSDCYYGGDYRKEHVEAMERLQFVIADSILAHPTHDMMWEFLETVNDYPESFAIPMLLATGWFDHYPGDVLRAFEDIRTRSDVTVRSSHKLVVGPWLHTGMGKSEQGGLDFPESVGLLDSMAVWFFHRYLLEEENGYEGQPVMQYFVMGENAWHQADSWPTEATSTDTLYLESDGLLSEIPPISSSDSDGFLYDPKDPSPTFGGSRFNPFNPFILTGPRDQRFMVESRSDAMVFSTPVLTEPLTVLGSLGGPFGSATSIRTAGPCCSPRVSAGCGSVIRSKPKLWPIQGRSTRWLWSSRTWLQYTCQATGCGSS
jgi:predicted acyl esterase